MNVIDNGHLYELTGDQVVQFIKRVDGKLVNEGTTNEELLEVLINRTIYLDSKFPCFENAQALYYMKESLKWFESRTKARIAQGVETKDVVHSSVHYMPSVDGF